MRTISQRDTKLSCPLCGDSCERIIDLSAFQLKGGGWFRDGYVKKTESKKEDKE